MMLFALFIVGGGKGALVGKGLCCSICNESLRNIFEPMGWDGYTISSSKALERNQ